MPYFQNFPFKRILFIFIKIGLHNFFGLALDSQSRNIELTNILHLHQPASTSTACVQFHFDRNQSHSGKENLIFYFFSSKILFFTLQFFQISTSIPNILEFIQLIKYKKHVALILTTHILIHHWFLVSMIYNFDNTKNKFNIPKKC